MTKNDPDLSKALWRYGIISPLLHRRDDDPTLADMLCSLAKKTFIRPDGVPIALSAETLRKWLYRYRSDGIKALEDQLRSDKGHQQIPQSVADALARLRKEHPNWTLAKVLEQMLKKGLWNGIKPSRATLYRFAAANQLHRSSSKPPVTRSFAFTDFGQLWVADFMHGPKLRYGKHFKKAILHTIIDDATRYVVSARFYFKETVEVLIPR